MTIAGVFGSLGEGKDLLLNFFLRREAEKGRKIITHVKLNLPHEYLAIEEIFEKGISDTMFFKDSILYLSEFHLIMDSRRSTAGVNVDFSQSILIQLGKIDCDLWYSAQLLSQIDLRIKEMQKYFYFVTKTFRPLEQPIPKGYSIDLDRRIVRHPVTKKPLPFDLDIDVLVRKGELFNSNSAVLPWEILCQLFDNYDTREIIKFDRKRYLKK